MIYRVLAAIPLMAIIAFGSLSVAPSDVSGTDLDKRIDAALATWDRPDAPGVAVLVQRNGRDIYRRCLGLANLELGVEIGPETCFDFASVSKHLTAFGILLLAEEGKLSLDDPVRRYLPELPACAEAVRVRHLLHQSSGLWEFWTILNRYSGFHRRDYIRMRDVLTLLAGQPALKFEPGSRYEYTNTNYSLLSLVVERAGGAPFGEWMVDHVFFPLGMEHTRFQVDCAELIPGKAAAYLKNGGTYRLARPSNVEVPGSAHAFTNIEDMSRWLSNFRDKRLGGEHVFETLFASGVLNDGTQTYYAAGLIVDERNGIRTISHSGQTGGYKTMLVWCPDDELGIVVLANERSINAFGIAYEILDICTGTGEKEYAAASGGAGASDTPETFEASEDLLDRYAGGYRLEDGGQLIGVYRYGKRLFAAIKGLGGDYFSARSETDFSDYSGNTLISFELDGGTAGLSLTMGDRILRAQRIVIGPRASSLAVEAGGFYYCEPLGCLCEIGEEEGKLILKHRRYGAIDLHRIDRDDLLCEWGFITLERDGDGPVTGFMLSDELLGWHGLRFDKIGG